MILIDANVLMYANGVDHPNKASSIRFLQRVAACEVEATVDAEILQEIIHRYRSLKRWQEGVEVYNLSRALCPEVLAITGAVMDAAKALVDKYPSLSARDAVHAAVVAEYELEGICSFDGDFDCIRGCRRINPLAQYGSGLY